jgi:hypothetical protein
MEELIRTPFVREVSAICVDPSPTRPPLPPWLKSVPTLVILGEDSPRIGPGPVNNWLFERKMGGGARAAPPSLSVSAPRNSVAFDDRRMAPDTSSRVAPPARGDVGIASNGRLPVAISASTEGDKGAAPPVLAGSDTESKVAAYHNLEMSDKKWSDIYSFLKDRPLDFADKTFELLSGLLSGGGGGGGGGGEAGGKAATRVNEKEAALLREFEAYASKRDREVKGPVARR